MTLNISRRAVLRGMAAISATGASGAALAAPGTQTPELPIERCRRLADELAIALDELAEQGTFWVARVLPAHMAEYPVTFEDINTRRDPVERYSRAKHDLVAAMKAMHPECVDWRVVDSSDNPVMTAMFLIVGHEQDAVDRMRAAKAVRS